MRPFIGLLWRRWGTPPAHNSEFLSGFEEEFAIARSRRAQTPLPEIWMFFKNVEPAQIADAGAQLQHVINFRESLIASKAIFFKEFESVDAWERMLRSCLNQHLLGIARAPSGAPEGPSERASQPTKSISTDANSPDAPAAGHQIAALAHSLAPAFAAGDLGRIGAALDDSDEATFLAVRSVLLSAALVSATGSSATPLPTHELNTLFRYRERLQAADEELQVLFKTIMADDFDVKPGWYWFRDIDGREAVAHLILIVLFRNDTEAQTRSFEILRLEKVPLFTMVPDHVLERTLREIPPDLRDAAWAYLVDMAQPDDLNKLLKWSHGTWLESRLQWLQAWMETGRDLDAFLPKIPDPQLIPEPMKQSIRGCISQMSDASLQALRSMFLSDLTEAAETELLGRGAVLGDAWNTHVRRRHGAITSALLGIGGDSEASETDEERYERLSRENTDSFTNPPDWYALDGPTIYQLLVERGNIAKEVARADLSNRFQRVRDESRQQRTKEALDAELVERHLKELAKYDEFITRMFTAATLTALAKEPATADVVIARPFLKDDLAHAAALRIVSSKGTALDVNDLIEIARTNYGAERKVALEGVQRLAADRLDTAKTLLALEGWEMHRAALSLVPSLSDQDALPLLQELLSHESANVRIVAVGQLRARRDDVQLVDLLRKYTDFGTYFYNVVTWLDRLIYAPRPILKYYETELKSRLEALDR